MDEEEKTDLQILQEALHAAKVAFEASLEKENEDGAYFGFEFHGWTYGSDFSEKMKHAQIDDHNLHKKTEVEEDD